jgi:hypothetical protein
VRVFKEVHCENRTLIELVRVLVLFRFFGISGVEPLDSTVKVIIA